MHSASNRNRFGQDLRKVLFYVCHCIGVNVVLALSRHKKKMSSTGIAIPRGMQDIMRRQRIEYVENGEM